MFAKSMEVALEIAEVVELLTKNAAILREEIELLEAGVVSCQSFGADISSAHAARLRMNLDRLEAIIAALRAH